MSKLDKHNLKKVGTSKGGGGLGLEMFIGFPTISKNGKVVLSDKFGLSGFDGPLTNFTQRPHETKTGIGLLTNISLASYACKDNYLKYPSNHFTSQNSLDYQLRCIKSYN